MGTALTAARIPFLGLLPQMAARTLLCPRAGPGSERRRLHVIRICTPACNFEFRAPPGGDAMSALDTPIPITFFPDYAAATKHEESYTPRALAGRIRVVTAPSKARLPWLKLARFGDTRTDKRSLRHDANLTAISGIEGDYDGGKMPMGEKPPNGWNSRASPALSTPRRRTPRQPRAGVSWPRYPNRWPRIDGGRTWAA